MVKVFDLQPVLQNATVRLQPLKEEDFDRLYAVASDPLIWEQHPNKNRFQREVFRTFFEGAMASGGAFLILDVQTHKVIGCTRFYDLELNHNRITIGYTFYSRSYWGGKYNQSAKTLMLDHAFKTIENVFFHIGAFNIRSQKAIQKLGAVKISEEERSYHGEAPSPNFIYAISKAEWLLRDRTVI